MDVEAAFRRRVKQLVMERYPSLDRFYLETGFSKGHLGQIIRGDKSPSVSTLVRLAKLLGVEVKAFFESPERRS